MKAIRSIFAALCAAAFLFAGADVQAQDKASDKVSFAMSSTSMLNLPLYAADVMGYFGKHGIDGEIIKFNKGGSTALAAVISGSTDVYIGATSSAIRAVQNGTDAVIIATVMSEFPLNIVVSKKAAAEHDITAETPIEQRIAALKGMRIGVTGAGSATHQIVQYALSTAGLDPTRDATIAFVGSGADMLAALASGNVDAVVGANPTSDIAVVQQDGMLLVNGTAGEYPGLKGIAHLVAVTTRSWAVKNPDLTRRVVASIHDGQAAIRDPNITEQARDLVHKKYFESIDKKVFDLAWTNVIPAFPESPRFSANEITRNIDFLNAFSEEKYEVDAEKVYTNEYVATE